MMTCPGGYVGGEVSAPDRPQLAPLLCLTLKQYDLVDWKEKSTTSRWTTPVIKNQFRLRNVKIDQRTESEAQLLVRKGVIRQDTDPLPLSGARDVLIQRLKLVVEAEDAAATRDRAVRQVESELAERHRLAERDRERRSRVGRGQTSRYQ